MTESPAPPASGLHLHPEAGACGKVILVGEHAVVHGVPALAAGLPDGLCLRASKAAQAQSWTRVQIPAWELDLELHPDSDHPVARACLAVLGHCDGPLTGWVIRGETALPSRAGLGSSATLAVALARLVLGPAAAPSDLETCAQAGEEVFHGTPSGIDTAVAARGGVIRFCKGDEPRALELAAPLPLAVIPSLIPRSTADQVAKVHARRAAFPAVMTHTLAAFGEVSAASADALAAGDWPRLGQLFDLCHGLLGAIDVSNAALDELCHEARKAGALGAKLTGAGGGGSILALSESPERVAAHFRDRGLPAFAVHIAASAAGAPSGAPSRT